MNVNKIFKYKLKLDPGMKQTITMPAGSKLLTAQDQRGELVLWSLLPVNPKEPEERCFVVAETGSPFPFEVLQHLGTVQYMGGAHVLHVFEVAQ